MFSKLFLAVAVVAVVVNAQDEPFPPCVLACAYPAATQNGCDPDNDACLCGSAQFIIDATACVTAHCSAADLATGTAALQSVCSALGITPSGPTTTPQSVSFTLASTSSGGASTSTGAGTSTGASVTSSGTKTSTGAGSSSTHTGTTSPAASSTHTTPATSAPAATSSKASASGLVAQGGGAIIGAVLAGVLAL